MKLLTIFEILLLCLLFNLASCQLARKNEAGQSVEQAEKDLMKKRAKAAKADRKAKKNKKNILEKSIKSCAKKCSKKCT